ncbi:MAG: ankyrin repeat domain-containing protein [Blastocatellia bacterium]
MRFANFFLTAWFLAFWTAAPGAIADRNKALWDAADKGNEEKVEALLAEGANPNTIRGDFAPLMLAAINGKVRMTRALLKAGAKPDAANKNGWTALHYAAFYDHSEVIKALLEARPPVEALSRDRVTPLMTAVRNGHAGTAKALLDGGANIEAESLNGYRPLMMAAASGSRETVKLLLEKGAQVNLTDNKGETALMFAAARGAVESARMLLGRGADPSLASKEGATAASIAAREQKHAVGRLLKEFQNGGLEAIRPGAPGEKPLMRIGDIDVWLDPPKRSHQNLNDLRAEEKVRVQTAWAKPDHKEEMEDETLYTLVERHLVADAKKAGADGILIRNATTNNQSVSQSTPTFGQSVLLGTLAGLRGGSIIVLPGRNVFIDKTHTVLATAIQYGPEMPVAATSGQAADATLQVDVAFWNSVKDSKDPGPLQLYLDKFPNGYFTDLARMRLKAAAERKERERGPAIFYVYHVPTAPGKPSFFIDGLEVARLLGGYYLKLVISPGPKTVVTGKHDRPGIVINVVGGETYYLRSNWSWRREEHVDVIDEMQGRGELAPMKPLETKWIRDTSLLHKDQSLP